MRIQEFRKDLFKLGIILLIPLLFGVSLLAWQVGLDAKTTGDTAPVGVAGVPLLGRVADLTSMTSGIIITSGTAPVDLVGKLSTRDLCLKAFHHLEAGVTSETRRSEAATLALEAMVVKPESREQARRVGRNFTRIYAALADYYRERQWENFAAAEARLKRLLADFHRHNGEFERLMMDPAMMRELKSETPEALADGELQTWKIKSKIEDSMLALLVYHEQWARAAELARGLKRVDGWILEKELLARLGPPGQRFIAARSAARNLKAFKRSVLSIGPDFCAPHHEPGD